MSDEYSLTYGKSAELPARRYSYEVRLNRVARALACGSGSVLDIGSATADYAIDLARIGLTITCLDINWNDLITAKRKQGEIALVAGTAASLPFADSSFDSMIVLNAFRYFDSPETVLRECRRVLKNNGSLLIMEHNRYCPDTILIRKNVVRYSSSGELARMLVNTGFQIETSEMQFIPPPFLPESILGIADRISDRFKQTLVGRVFPEFLLHAIRRE